MGGFYDITKFALIMAGISILGIMPMVLLRPAWRILSWWSLMGLGFSILLLVVSFFRGAYLTAQKWVAMVDKLNDCYQGVTPEEMEGG